MLILAKDLLHSIFVIRNYSKDILNIFVKHLWAIMPSASSFEVLIGKFTSDCLTTFTYISSSKRLLRFCYPYFRNEEMDVRNLNNSS
jgi:hypothetical protein